MGLLLNLSMFLLCCAHQASDAKNINTLDSIRSVLKFQQFNNHDRKYRDCQELWDAGERTSKVSVIYPNGSYPIKVFCSHTDVGAFTVIQRRMYGNINFYTAWPYYKAGFGDPQGDYWAGLQAIYHLTQSGTNKLRIDMSDWHGNNRFATYNHFSIQSEAHLYQLAVAGFRGNVPDDLAFHNGMYFATWDRPDHNNCSVNFHAGWWYNYCAYSLLNGHYYVGGPYSPTRGYYDGIYWKDWVGYGYSLKFVSMSLYR